MTELSRPFHVDRLPDTLLVEATPAECTALAARLQIPEVRSLACRFTLDRKGRTIQATGLLTSDVVQTCVVSLEPVPQSLAERFTIHFVPAGQESANDDPDSPDEIPYAPPTIDLGEAVAEQLALSLDPYPRLEGAQLESPSPETPNPFATLSALRPKN